jgi:hypothetical protein
MSAFFKSFGKGILYLLTLPVVLVVLIFYAIVGVFVFLFLMVKSIILFFRAKTIFNDFPEDIKVKEILEPKVKEDPVEVIEPEKEEIPGAFTHTYFQSGTTSYPTFEKPVETIEEVEPEQLPEAPELEVGDIEESPLFEDEPEIESTSSSGKDDTEMQMFDLGSKRIFENDDK